MRLVIRARQVLLGVAVAALAAVAAALVSQHVFDMQPCPWCVLQRFLFIVVALFALVGAFTSGGVRRAAVLLALVAGACGVASALWQQLHAVNQLACDRTLAEQVIVAMHLDSLFPNVFMALASCADAAVNLLGIPYAVWSCALFVVLSLVLAWALRFDLRRGR